MCIRDRSKNVQALTFTRTGPFTGTLNGLTPGTVVVDVNLWHKSGNHADFGPHPLAVTVQ